MPLEVSLVEAPESHQVCDTAATVRAVSLPGTCESPGTELACWLHSLAHEDREKAGQAPHSA